MKVIILLAGFGTRMRPHTWSRPKALMKVAGHTVLGHLLDMMKDVLDGEVIFVVGYKGEQIRAWVETNYGHLNTHFVVQDKALGQAHAVGLCREYLEDDSEVIVAFGDGVVKADFANFKRQQNNDIDAVFTTMYVDDPRPFGVVCLNDDGFITNFVEKPDHFEDRNAAVGINWFRSSKTLMESIDTIIEENRQTKGEYYMADAYQVLLERNMKIRTMPVEYWLDAGKPNHILTTNQRLLSYGVGASKEAIERGYAEGFTVIPPVYIHDSAEIDSSVIGPYAHIDAGATIKGSVVRNAIIDPGADVENIVLDQSLIGENATVKGSSKKLFVGDKSFIDIG